MKSLVKAAKMIMAKIARVLTGITALIGLSGLVLTFIFAGIVIYQGYNGILSPVDIANSDRLFFFKLALPSTFLVLIGMYPYFKLDDFIRNTKKRRLSNNPALKLA